MSEPWPLSISISVFIVAALATVVGGVRLATSGDVLADRTGMGEAFFGAVFFGGMISLSGIVMTATLDETFVTLITIFMTTVLLGGMIRRERQGPVGIGWESVLLLVTYVAMIILITWGVNGT